MVINEKNLPTTTFEMMNQYEKPPILSKKEQFKRFFYNSETGAVFGRTGSDWGRIGLFYTVFYAALAALVAFCFWVFMRTVDPRTPTWTLDRSIIGTNPGLGFRPLPPATNVESTLIWYKVSDEKNYMYWVDALDSFLNVYKTPGLTPGQGANIANCDYDHPPNPGQVCAVDLKDWSPCTYENRFGYHKSSPCIFLKLNKIYGWRPEYYNDTGDLPEKMPATLKDYIKKLPTKERNTVWVSCEGENHADKEYIGPVKIYPRPGFPGYFYPYENSEGYLSPLVAVHFERPRQGLLINVECKAWAKNIIHNRNDRLGSVHFELMVD